ncbi:hypothetical protein MA16_Dca028455 [Dendrobium catenatum]|uniref:Uncharacterized protein n=1 Tax=Dendrobium catenatum TaxID=906689 RepID=A0A2I0V6N9_9ASPA|nr:hypothetical protein MA16_Dca028455 [Dendrobium catenatum]
MGIPSDVVGGVRPSKRSTFMVAASPNEPRVIDSKTSPTQGSFFTYLLLSHRKLPSCWILELILCSYLLILISKNGSSINSV